VALWEAAPHPGGKIGTCHRDGYSHERAAGLLVNFRPEVDHLIDAAGLASVRQARSPDSNRYVVKHGRLVGVPMRISAMAASPLWSRRTKLRLLAEILVPKGGDELESVSAFISRRFGREILEGAIEPFVAGTLASDPDLAIAQAVLPRLTRLEQHYGSITLGMLVNRLYKRRRANNADTFSFAGGMSTLIDALASAPGIRVQCNRSVTGIDYRQGRWRVEGSDPRCGTVVAEPSALVLATPAYGSAGLLRSVDRELAQQLTGIEYAPLAVVHLGLRRADVAHPLDGSGFLVARRERLRFNGNLWMSSLFPHRAPQGRTLLSSYMGGARDPQRLQLTDDRLTDQLLGELTPLLGISGTPEYRHIDRHPRALPLYHGDYLQRIATVQARLRKLPGLHLCGNYIDGVSVRERIYAGSTTAAKIARAFDSVRKAPRPQLHPSPSRR
jgi:oxygen-dependent protoporphyrinogen oxidase